MIHSRRFALPLLCAPFIARGVEALRDPQAQVKTSGQVSAALAARLGISADPERLVLRTAQIQIVAGSLLGLGRARRLAALTLLLSMLPTTYADHEHAQDDPGHANLARDLGLMGGLLREVFARHDTTGSGAVALRALGNALGPSTASVAPVIKDAAMSSGRGVRRAGSGAARAADRATARSSKMLRRLGETSATQVEGIVSAGLSRAGDAIGEGADSAGQLLAAKLHRRTA